MLSTTQTSLSTSKYEKVIVHIMRHLPPEKMLELVDFARFLEFQVTQRDGKLDDLKDTETPGDSEEKWVQLLAKPEAKRKLREMAREATEDYQAGQTTEIAITKDGRITPV